MAQVSVRTDAVADGRPIEGRRRPRADVVTVLTVYFVLLYAIPAPMTITALGQVGGPATVLALGCFLWWCWHALHRTDRPPPVGRAVLTAVLSLLLVWLAAYAHSATLPIPGDERSPADAALLRLFGFVGVVCLMAGGISNRERLWTLVERIAMVVGVLTLLAAIQMATGDLWVDRLDLPFLSPGVEAGLVTRGLLTRPSGTSTHPIEFAAVLSMGLPFVLAAAGRDTPRRRLFAAIAALTGVVLFMTGSRTAMVCGAVALLAMMPAWSARVRVLNGAAALLILAGLFVLKPGFVGTLRGLFLGAGSDSSVLSRTNSYAVVQAFWETHPWLGRGMGTFLPRYWILDNQLLGVLIGVGVIGLAALLACIVAAAGSATVVARAAADEDDRHLAIAARAALVAGTVSLALFDVFGFAQAAGTFFLAVGLCGAVAARHAAELADREWRPSVSQAREMERS